MANFKEYLNFTSSLVYKDKQIEAIAQTNILEEMQEKLSQIGEHRRLLVFAHPECPDCLRTIGVLEAMRRYIPLLEIDYRKRSEDKELLLQYYPEGRIPAIFLIDGIKVSSVFLELPESVRKETNIFKQMVLRNDFHKGCYDDEIIHSIYEALK